MKCTRHTLRLVAVTLMLAPFSYGQEPPVPEPGDGNVVHVVQLTHADADTVAAVIRGLGLRVNVVAAPDGNVLMYGQEADIARALELVAKLDAPGSSPTAGVQVEVIPIGDIDTRTLTPALASLVTGSQSSFAVDARNRVLVVQARDDEIASVRDFLARVDKPLDSVTVELFFLRAMIGSTGGDHDRDLPSALVPIAKTLTKTGFANVSLMAPFRLTCRLGREFSSRSRLRTNPADGTLVGDDIEFQVLGGVRDTAVQDTVELTVDASIGGNLIDAELVEVGDIDFGVNVTIAAKFGQYVILSAAPSSTANGEAVAVIVRVTKDSAQ